MSNFLKRSSIERLIRSSKERSQIKHRLSASARSPILRLQCDEISYRNERFLDHIGGAASEVDQSALLPRQARYCLLITDSDGIVIESYAPPGMEAEYQRSGLVRGAIWDERVAGTNGISMTMETGRVLTIRGKDHFYSCFNDFSCSSAPLTDAENNLIGTITLVGSANRRSEENALCEQALKRASRQFQTRLFRNFHSDKMTARILSRDQESQRRFETLVACDEDGMVMSHLPLWRDEARPMEHQNLVGRHLSELENLEISVRGPAAIPPRRRILQKDTPKVSARIDKEARLGRLVAEGGNLPILAERARKIVAHRIPMLICGEPGVGAEEFARALLEEQNLNSPMSLALDAASSGSEADLTEALRSIEFLSDYPVEKIVPTLILRNIDCLSDEAQAALECFLDANDTEIGAANRVQKPVLLFTAGKSWKALETSEKVPRSLLYLLSQSVVELPPLILLDRETVLENVVEQDFSETFELAESAKDLLIEYDWPGNRREMRAVLREALICGNGKRINITDLPARLLNRKENYEKKTTRASLRAALDSTGWNVTKAARLLGKSRATVNRWIASEGLKRPE